MIIRFQYVADLDEELRVKALIKVTDANVTPKILVGKDNRRRN